MALGRKVRCDGRRNLLLISKHPPPIATPIAVVGQPLLVLVLVVSVGRP